MDKSYLFIYNDEVGTRDELEGYLNKMLKIVHWRYDMPNMFYITSEYSADQIAQEFESIAGTKGRFIFMEYNSNSQGRLLSESWFLLQNKYHKPKE